MATDHSIAGLLLGAEVTAFFNSEPVVVPFESKDSDSFSELQLFGVEFPLLIRHVYLSSSLVELMCFAHLKGMLRDIRNKYAFCVLRESFQAPALKYLLQQFPSAKFHAVFPSDLPGKVCDCLLAVWLHRLTQDLRPEFSFAADTVTFSFHEKLYHLAEHRFSLHTFQKVTGLRFTNVRTHKPLGSANSYYTLVKELSQHDQKI